MTWDRQHSLLQNVAAISGDLHTHVLYWQFYEISGRHIDGFVGNYETCIRMAKALTAWEAANGDSLAYEDLGTTWIEIVERYVHAMINRSVVNGDVADAEALLRDVIEKARAP
jgi:hypothetical protein